MINNDKLNAKVRTVRPLLFAANGRKLFIDSTDININNEEEKAMCLNCQLPQFDHEKSDTFAERLVKRLQCGFPVFHVHQDEAAAQINVTVVCAESPQIAVFIEQCHAR